MTNVQLLQLAQVTAASVVSGSMSAFASCKAQIAAFETTGNPDADWPAFTQNFSREQQSYKAASAKDAAVASGTAPNAGIPANILAGLPPAVRARLAASGAAPPVPAPAAETAAK